MSASPEMQEKTPAELLLDEFIDDTEWRSYQHSPEELAREVAGTALDAVYACQEPQYEIDEITVGNVAGLIAECEGMPDHAAVNQRAAQLFLNGKPLSLVS